MDFEPPWTLDADVRIRAAELTVWRHRSGDTKFANWVGPNGPNPILAGGKIVASAFSPGSVTVVDAKVGDLIWRHNLPKLVAAEPLVCGETLLVRGDPGVVAFGLADGAVLWEAGDRSAGEYSSSLVSAGGLVFIGSSWGTIEAYDLASGALRWERRFPGSNSRINGLPLVADDRLIFGSNNGRVYALELNSGEIVWQKKIGDGMMATGSLHQGLAVMTSIYAIYGVATEDGRVTTLWEGDGREIGTGGSAGGRVICTLFEKERVENGYDGRLLTPITLNRLSGPKLWRTYYPPHTGANLLLSAETGYLYEATSAGIGITDPDTGIRRWVISNFGNHNGIPDDSTCLPWVTRDHLYVQTTDGSLLCLRHPR